MFIFDCKFSLYVDAIEAEAEKIITEVTEIEDEDDCDLETAGHDQGKCDPFAEKRLLDGCNVEQRTVVETILSQIEKRLPYHDKSNGRYNHKIPGKSAKCPSPVRHFISGVRFDCIKFNLVIF